jgi:hypothetical protein
MNKKKTWFRLSGINKKSQYTRPTNDS